MEYFVYILFAVVILGLYASVIRKGNRFFDLYCKILLVVITVTGTFMLGWNTAIDKVVDGISNGGGAAGCNMFIVQNTKIMGPFTWYWIAAIFFIASLVFLNKLALKIQHERNDENKN